MEVELHQLTLRYERLRKRHPRAERALLSSLAEIGQVLRHDSAGATAVYARVDAGRLRTIARAWPAGAVS